MPEVGPEIAAFERDRVACLARIWAAAIDVWGDSQAAMRFFTRPHPLLGGKEPLGLVLEDEIGSDLVGDILGRLKYGTAA